MNYPFYYKDRTFTIDTEDQTRVVAFEDGKPIWKEYTQFNIREDGQLKGFVFEHELVPEAIRQMVDFPNQAEAINSRFD